jgi:hypothetical protein
MGALWAALCAVSSVTTPAKVVTFPQGSGKIVPIAGAQC